jgi:hypothetical protein
MCEGEANNMNSRELPRRAVPRATIAICTGTPAERAHAEGTFRNLESESRLHACVNWQEFAAAVEEAASLVVVIPWLGDSAATRHLRGIKRRAPDTPLVVVTSKDAENARMALDLGISDLVWLSELRQQLPRAIDRARQRSYLRRVAGNVEQAIQMPPPLRNAIAAACSGAAPLVMSVTSCD